MAGIILFPGPPEIRGSAPALTLHEASRYRVAALQARRAFPGPLGELVFRELSAYAEFGYRFSTDGLIPRLATAILSPLDQEATAPANNAANGAVQVPTWTLR